MTVEQRKFAFAQLGIFISNIDKSQKQALAAQAYINNSWFTENSINTALDGLAYYLEDSNLTKWLLPYNILNVSPKNIGVIAAGNIPAVSFHDILCVLMAGHTLHAKLSSDDTVIIKYLLQKLCEIEPAFAPYIHYPDKLTDIDAVIATGTNNTNRYFEYYYRDKPKILRKNRSSLAVITGNETQDELQLLGTDIFTYYGLGCRNVSKIIVPSGYDFNAFFEAMYPYNEVINHSKYANNYEYRRAIYLMNGDKFLDNNFMLLKESEQTASPVSVLYYHYYSHMNEVLDYINTHRENIQCVVQAGNNVHFGETQKPNLWDYADGVDTMQFLISI
ncbi:MAG: acyl-CoA reductase [Cytophagales bacterium]|nr:acyl-CoA reductase [Cytophagales bacterium]